MRLVSVNISAGRLLQHHGAEVTTGIFKEPTPDPVRVGTLGLEGDLQADKTVHGGEYKAVYAYSLAHYDWWRRELGRPDLAPGAFGENLTIEGLDEDDVAVGDVLAIRDVRLQAVQPRQPCFKLDLKFGDSWMGPRFVASGRYGIYFRVLQEGSLQAGNEVTFATRAAERFPVPGLARLQYALSRDPAVIRRVLQIPALVPRWRTKLLDMLASGALE